DGAVLLRDQFPNRRMNQVDREGLLDDPFDTGVAGAVGQLVVRLGGDEDKMSGRVFLANLLDHGKAIRPRQDGQVRYHDIKRSRSAQLRSFSAGSWRGNGVTVPHQR